MNAMDRVNERARKRAEIEVMMEEYRLEIIAYAKWMESYRNRTGRMHPLLPIPHETQTEAA